MKNSDILREARGRIEDRSLSYVCLAINHPKQWNGNDRENLKSWVLALLGSHYTLESWIEENCGVWIREDMKRDAEKMRVTRLAWIDWMIAYWEGKGQ
jgi:hypothetical protein